MNLVFDIETDDLKATKIWCIVAIDEDHTIHTFPPDKIEQGIEFLKNVSSKALILLLLLMNDLFSDPIANKLPIKENNINEYIKLLYFSGLVIFLSEFI